MQPFFVLWLQHLYWWCWCQRSDVEVFYVGTEDMLAVVCDTQHLPFLTVCWFTSLCHTSRQLTACLSDSSWSREQYVDDQRSSVFGIAHAQTFIQPLPQTQLTYSRGIPASREKAKPQRSCVVRSKRVVREKSICWSLRVKVACVWVGVIWFTTRRFIQTFFYVLAVFWPCIIV
jgi:hypothetical protein